MDTPQTFKSDPYLWLHLCGMATVPLWLEISFIALSTGDPQLPAFLEFLLIVTIGILPILWMQWQRPFYIYSLLLVAIHPNQLTLQQQTTLTFLRSEFRRVLAVAAAILLTITAFLLYQFAPIASLVNPLPPSLHFLGLMIAIVTFFFANLFFQVSLSVLWVVFNNGSVLTSAHPLTETEINEGFTIPGIRVKTILPDFSTRPFTINEFPSTSIPSSSSEIPYSAIKDHGIENDY